MTGAFRATGAGVSRSESVAGTAGAARAVILAAGRGTRMRRPAPGIGLRREQRAMAERGLKCLIPFHGRPFLDYVITALADAGIEEACLVVRPGADPVRTYCERARTRRVRLSFAVQPEPLGSANALLAAEDFAAGEPFIVVNADNYYPPAAVAALGFDATAPAVARVADGPAGTGARLHDAAESAGGAGRAVADSPPGSYATATAGALVGFRREALVARGNIDPDRIAAFALLTTHPDGTLAGIVEKPSPEARRRLGDDAPISMTLWRFGPSIFAACRAVGRSPRGEYELPGAVAHAMRERGERFRVVPSDEGVLDLSSRADIPEVEARLRGVRVDP